MHMYAICLYVCTGGLGLKGPLKIWGVRALFTGALIVLRCKMIRVGHHQKLLSLSTSLYIFMYVQTGTGRLRVRARLVQALSGQAWARWGRLHVCVCV